jgi:hypothetical protein
MPTFHYRFTDSVVRNNQIVRETNLPLSSVSLRRFELPRRFEAPSSQSGENPCNDDSTCKALAKCERLSAKPGPEQQGCCWIHVRVAGDSARRLML